MSGSSSCAAGRAIGVFGSHSRTRVDEFGPNDVGFIQQGYGHYIEQIGDEPTEIIILFNSRGLRRDLAGQLAGRQSGVAAGNQLPDSEEPDRSVAEARNRHPRQEGLTP